MRVQGKQILFLYQNASVGQKMKEAQNIAEYDVGRNGTDKTLEHAQLHIPHRNRAFALLAQLTAIRG